jgi:vitamin B12 transporter
MHLRILLFSTAALALMAARAGAQDLVIEEEILVTPNRTPTEVSKVGSKVETIDSETIEAQAKPELSDYLTLLPGVYVSPPGGSGQETSLTMRGADKKYVKTLFNGIDISDPTATQVQTAWEHLLIGGVANVEVLKGSQSTLYGSDAVAGVVGISTLGDIEPGLHHHIALEGGSFGTVRGGYALTGASDRGRGSLTLNGLSTDGISHADRRNGNTEADGYRNITGTFAGEHQVGENISVFGSGLLIRSDGEFDDSGNPPVDNLFNEGQTAQKGGRVGLNAELFDGRFRNTISAQVFDIDRDLHIVSAFGPFDANYQGLRTKFDYQGDFDVTDWLTVQFGADHERQRADVTDNYGTDTSDRFSISGVWGQVIAEPIDNLTLTAGLRGDRHSVFGGYSTYRLTAAYLFEDTGTKPHASFGTGFRAPSLYELYAPFGTGNPNLVPEESTSFDIGIEQALFDGQFVADVTYFQLDTDNLIDFSYATSSYVQTVGTTRRRGVETSLTWAALPWLDLTGAYTYTHTQQPDGARRPRVPVHDLALSATVRPAERWEFSATTHLVADVQDRISPSYGTFQDVALDDYVLLDAKIAYKPTDTMEIYLRGENLLNQKYQVVRGYGMPGIAVFGGFRASF